MQDAFKLKATKPADFSTGFSVSPNCWFGLLLQSSISDYTRSLSGSYIFLGLSFLRANFFSTAGVGVLVSSSTSG